MGRLKHLIQKSRIIVLHLESTYIDTEFKHIRRSLVVECDKSLSCYSTANTSKVSEVTGFPCSFRFNGDSS